MSMPRIARLGTPSGGKRRAPFLWLLAALAALATGCVPPDRAVDVENWPGRRPIYLAVFASPGGATDLSNRTIASVMEKELGTTIAALNMAGAQGGAAAAYAWNAPRNGRSWYGTAEGSLSLAVRGAHTATASDWSYYIIGGTPGVLSVPAASPHRSASELLEAARAQPARVRIATSIPGSAWHVQYLMLARAAGVTLQWVQYQGSHPSQVAALSGEVDAVLTGLGEQAEFLRAGRLRPLALMQTEGMTIEGVGSVPAITEHVPGMGAYLPLQQFTGFALPADTPEPILERIEQAFRVGMASEPVAQYARQGYVTLLGLSGEQAREFVRKQERVFAWALHDQELTVHSPAEFGIERP
jgi:tripartite-type tricarboxylate transporter receptor subunit TctC